MPANGAKEFMFYPVFVFSFVCLSACQHLYIKTTDRVFVKIFLWTRNIPSTSGCGSRNF